MYNTDFLPQLEKSRKHLFGLGEPREVSKEYYALYHPPSNLRILECKKDVNGEWVPSPLEKEVEKK